MAAARVVPPSLKLWPGALFAVGMGGAAGTYRYKTDEGTRRSVYFWSRAFPIYLHYRYIAQVGSTRADFLPHEYLSRLGIFQDSIPSAEPFPAIQQTIERSLGRRIVDVFSEFDPIPVGAASIGQVHRAVLRKTGEEVAVKVMYPQVERLFRSDISTIKAFCRLAQPEHLNYLDEVEKAFLTEFVYTREASNLRMIRRNMLQHYKGAVVVPRPIFATTHVLCMEYLRGEKLDKALRRNLDVIATLQHTTPSALLAEMGRQEARGEEVTGASRRELVLWRLWIRGRDVGWNVGVAIRNYVLRPLTLFWLEKGEWAVSPLPLNLAAMVELLWEVHGKQLLIDGCFNGDCHPGNILLLYPHQQLGLIDCGQVKHITLEQRLQLARLIVAVAKKDKKKVVSCYRAMGFRTANDSDEAIYKYALVIWDRDDKQHLGGKNIQEYLEELQKRDPVEFMPQDFVMAGRVALLLRGLTLALKYHVSAAEAWAPLAQRLLDEYGDEEDDEAAFSLEG